MIERFEKTAWDETCLAVVRNDEEIDKLHRSWWGRENVEITQDMLNELLKGNAIGWGDGEYSHVIALSDEVIKPYPTR
nr:MAG TPA: hypothetical protein [Caudoviricetes sp.]